jgi:hypothetical protein
MGKELVWSMLCAGRGQSDNPLGVLHKAIIVTPDDADRRIVNSTMLAVGERDEIGPAQQRDTPTTSRGSGT